MRQRNLPTAVTMRSWQFHLEISTQVQELVSRSQMTFLHGDWYSASLFSPRLSYEKLVLGTQLVFSLEGCTFLIMISPDVD